MRQILLPFGVITFFFIMLFGFIKLAGPIPFSVNSVQTTKSDLFRVSGQGKVTVSPDIAVVNVGVTATGSTANQAQELLNNSINKVSSSIKNLGIDQKDIQTSNYNIFPNYDYSNGRNRIVNYTANSNLTIKVRKLDNANQVLDTATAEGANQIGGIQFDVDDRTKAENEARQKAVEDAKRKADQAAKMAGFTLGKLADYSEDSGGGPQPMPLNARSIGLGVAEDKTQIEPGTSEIQITVTLGYQIL